MTVNVPTKVIPVWFIEKWVKEESDCGSPLRRFIEQMEHAWEMEEKALKGDKTS